MKINELLKTRRSVRDFRKKQISLKKVESIIKAGIWAPSGLNNQPWKFLILEKEKKDELSRFTKYYKIILEADKIILVFLDKNKSYHYEKDLMSTGACIQNMLIYIHALGLGGCWLGEIINQRIKVESFLKTEKSLELEAVIALGVPLNKNKITPERNPLKQFLINN